MSTACSIFNSYGPEDLARIATCREGVHSGLASRPGETCDREDIGKQIPPVGMDPRFGPGHETAASVRQGEGATGDFALHFEDGTGIVAPWQWQADGYIFHAWRQRFLAGDQKRAIGLEIGGWVHDRPRVGSAILVEQ